jgi:hypothetical protein
LLWKLAFIVQRLWVASRHVESATKLFFWQFTLRLIANRRSLEQWTTLVNATGRHMMKRRRHSYVQTSLGLYFKTLKPVQHMQKSPEKATLPAESHHVSNDFAQVSTK